MGGTRRIVAAHGAALAVLALSAISSAGDPLFQGSPGGAYSNFSPPAVNAGAKGVAPGSGNSMGVQTGFGFGFSGADTGAGATVSFGSTPVSYGSPSFSAEAPSVSGASQGAAAIAQSGNGNGNGNIGSFNGNGNSGNNNGNNNVGNGYGNLKATSNNDNGFWRKNTQSPSAIEADHCRRAGGCERGRGLY